MDCSPRGSFAHGISQTRILEWVAISFCRGSSWPRDWTHVSCLGGGFFTTESPGKILPPTRVELECKGDRTTICREEDQKNFALLLWPSWWHSKSMGTLQASNSGVRRVPTARSHGINLFPHWSSLGSGWKEMQQEILFEQGERVAENWVSVLSQTMMGAWGWRTWRAVKELDRWMPMSTGYFWGIRSQDQQEIKQPSGLKAIILAACRKIKCYPSNGRQWNGMSPW